jgi:hypothetical protein
LLDVLSEFAQAKASPGQSQSPGPIVAPVPLQDADSESRSSFWVPIKEKAPAAQSSPEVLQKLNRGQDERTQKVRSKAGGAKSADPMIGF